MSKTLQVTRRQAMFLMLGVMVAAFLGVLVGSFIIPKTSNIQRFETNILLKAGQAFPEAAFVSLDGRDYNLPQLLQGKKSILIFLTTDCPHCELLISRL